MGKEGLALKLGPEKRPPAEARSLIPIESLISNGLSHVFIYGLQAALWVLDEMLGFTSLSLSI